MTRTISGRLTELAEQEGMTALELVMKTIREEGSVMAAARKLNASPRALQYHLERAHLKVYIENIVRFEHE